MRPSDCWKVNGVWDGEVEGVEEAVLTEGVVREVDLVVGADVVVEMVVEVAVVVAKGTDDRMGVGDNLAAATPGPGMMVVRNLVGGLDVVVAIVTDGAVLVAKGTSVRAGAGANCTFVCMDIVSENAIFAAAIPRPGAMAVRSGAFQCLEFSWSSKAARSAKVLRRMMRGRSPSVYVTVKPARRKFCPLCITKMSVFERSSSRQSSCTLTKRRQVSSTSQNPCIRFNGDPSEERMSMAWVP